MTYYDKEMEKLEKQQRQLREQQEKGQWDRYNTVEEKVDENDYKDILQSSLEYCPKRGQKWLEYAIEVRVHSKAHQIKSLKTHVECKRQWYTHRSPLGCFMCEDINLISVLTSVIRLMAEISPDNRF